MRSAGAAAAGADDTVAEHMDAAVDAKPAARVRRVLRDATRIAAVARELLLLQMVLRGGGQQRRGGTERAGGRSIAHRQQHARLDLAVHLLHAPHALFHVNHAKQQMLDSP